MSDQKAVMNGRIFPTDSDHSYVAHWLRGQAKRGFQRGDDPASWRYVNSCTGGVNLHPWPDSIGMILTRDMVPDCRIGWHLSVCCVTDKKYRGYIPDEGEYWLNQIFGSYSRYAVMSPLGERSLIGVEKDVRHWIIECAWNDRADPKVNLDGLEGDVTTDQTKHSTNSTGRPLEAANDQ